jgi:hypothetical protein
MRYRAPSDTNPDDANHNVQTLILPTFMLVAPHAICLLVPVRPRRAVHASPPNVGLPVCACSFGPGAGSGRRIIKVRRGAARLVQGRRRDQMLDDSAIDSVLVARLAAGGRRFGDERAQDGILRKTITSW